MANDDQADVIDALVQVRNTLGTVENGLMLDEAVTGQKLLGDSNTLRSELLLLNWAIAKLGGLTDQVSPAKRDQVAVSRAAS
ncbi:hypothetical protein [Pseudomonas sp.]|uniref:hypothetical protein n=1 Tax=Pseudomonas sp. TaxID=306 RepID=UPI0027364751|nr:hypothetical protein [Pseudomonas sp.]MDP2746201.1 hypothetical protein [Pseudomonas sp.]